MKNTAKRMTDKFSKAIEDPTNIIYMPWMGRRFSEANMLELVTGAKRDQGTMSKRFTTKPQDVYTIKTSSSCMTNTIWVKVTNELTGESFDLTFSNELNAWETLKKVSELHARKVMVQCDDETPIPYNESAPYIHRFNN